jgi:hypothetical protein
MFVSHGRACPGHPRSDIAPHTARRAQLRRRPSTDRSPRLRDAAFSGSSSWMRTACWRDKFHCEHARSCPKAPHPEEPPQAASRRTRGRLRWRDVQCMHNGATWMPATSAGMSRRNCRYRAKLIPTRQTSPILRPPRQLKGASSGSAALAGTVKRRTTTLAPASGAPTADRVSSWRGGRMFPHARNDPVKCLGRTQGTST